MSSKRSTDDLRTGRIGQSVSIDDVSELWPAVIRWGEGQRPTTEQLDRLQNWPIEKQIWQRLFSQTTQDFETQGLETDRIFNSEERTAKYRLTRRAGLLQLLSQRLVEGTEQLPIAGPWRDQIVPLWSFWLPLALQIDAAQKQLNAVYVQGILGGQGTGKSTLASMLHLLLGLLGHRSVSLSIDDLYLTYRERVALAKQDPRLVWRGPPGTHDVALGLRTLQRLTGLASEPVAVPRFDKSQYEGQGDRTEPLIVSSPTIVLFEGWFVGVQPLPEAVINADTFVFPSPIASAGDRQFSRDCNHKLREYSPLWDYLHSLVVLRPGDYRLSLQWRQDAEHKMIAAGRPGLSPDEIASFVTYFWKALHPNLFIAPLVSGETEESGKRKKLKASLVVNIGSAHQIESLCLSAGRTDEAV